MSCSLQTVITEASGCLGECTERMVSVQARLGVLVGYAAAGALGCNEENGATRVRFGDAKMHGRRRVGHQ